MATPLTSRREARMNGPWKIHILEQRQTVYEADVDGPVVLGRQRVGERAPYAHYRDGKGWRLVLAPLADNAIPRDYVAVEPLPNGTARLTNLSGHIPLPLPERADLRPGASCTLPLPAVFHLGSKAVRVEFK